LAKSYQLQDCRVKVLQNIHNSGPGFSRLQGIKYSLGEYIAFIDSDDLWVNNKLQTQLSFMLDNKADFSFTGFRRFLSDSNRAGRYLQVPKLMSYKKLFSNTVIATSTVMVHRSLLINLENIEVSKKYVEDYILFFRLLSRGALAWGLNKDLMRYRIQKNSFSRNKPKYAVKVWRTYRKIERLSIFVAAYYFSCYAVRGFIKYLRF
jgi:teichuronic acid biosynthesis glycosyltransferase TuaG